MANETNVPIQRVKAPEVTRLPIFDEIGKRWQEIERRAFELFQQRGRGFGQDLEDWLRAEGEVNGSATTKLEETDESYNLQVSLPDMAPSEVEVTATPHSIILHAEHREETSSKSNGKGKAKEGEWSQVRQTCVYREVPLAGIDPDQVTAHLENGTLQVSARKAASAEHQRRVIAVA